MLEYTSITATGIANPYDANFFGKNPDRTYRIRPTSNSEIDEFVPMTGSDWDMHATLGEWQPYMYTIIECTTPKVHTIFLFRRKSPEILPVLRDADLKALCDAARHRREWCNCFKEPPPA